MRRRTIPLPALLGALAALAPLTAAADNIRGTIRGVVRLTLDSAFEQTTQLGYGEMVLVTLPEDVTFLDAVQIELTLSAESRAHYDNFGFVIYDRLDSVPALGFAALTGRRAFLHALLPLNRVFYLARVGGDSAWAHDLPQGIFRPQDPRLAGDYPILVGVQAIMKGIPESAEGLVFYVKARPVLRNAGLLVLRIRPPAGAHVFEVSIDGVPVDTARSPGAAAWEASQELAAGLHTVRVVSSTLLPSESTFTIDPARTRVLELELREPGAYVQIEAPRGAQVYLDGRKLDYPRESRVRLDPGDHLIRYFVGDYSPSMSFTVAEGKSYTVYLEMSIGVKED